MSAGDDHEDAEYSLILHGPPGSSKTAITQALADIMWPGGGSRSRSGPRLIRITPADFTRLGEDRIDSEARLIFELLRRVRKVTILFDEIDDLLRQRAEADKLYFLDLVVPAMLNRLQDLRDVCPRQEICFLLATNYIERIERALIRKGRIDAPLAVVYPDRESRGFIVNRHVRELREIGSDQGQAWASWGAKVLETRWRKPGPHVKHLDGVPWKTFEEILRAFRQDLKATFEAKGPGRPARAWAKLRSRIKAAGPRELSTFYDRDRVAKRIGSSPELQDEVLLQVLSTTEASEEFNQTVISRCECLALAPETFETKLTDRIWSRKRKSTQPVA